MNPTNEELVKSDLIDRSLELALLAIARTPRLLICCDYDGTLAPIVSDPGHAYPLAEAVAALRTLAALPATQVAVISGRALRDLAALSRLPAEVHLVGSHGTEFDLDFVHTLKPEQHALRARLLTWLHAHVDQVSGASLEIKPASIAVHVRNCAEQDETLLISELETGPATWPGVEVKRGKKILEFSVVSGDKGHAMDLLRHQFAASATLFLGDDITDESGFARLGGIDVGVKVGEGESLAVYRLPDPNAVVLALARLQEERQRWFTGGHAEPIEEHALLADGAALALVSPSASICWLCHPGPDGPAVFAALLGDESSGHFTVKPQHGGQPLAQTYVPGTMTVRTRFSGLDVVDFLDTELGPLADGSPVTRLIRILSGTSVAEVVFAPRPEFGMVSVSLELVPQGVVVHGGSDPIVLRSPGVRWDIRGDAGQQEAVALVDPRDGDVTLELRLGTTNLDESQVVGSEARLINEMYWTDWLSGLEMPEYGRSAVERSALTLRALCHRPTGGILAAATMGLPEWVGGTRNWDYRYVWIRDAALTAHTLLDLGSTAETDAYLAWLHRVLTASVNIAHLHPLYMLSGGTLPPEAVLDVFPGYAGSRPVRIGNAAQGQAQLDVLGPVCDLLAARARIRGSALENEMWLVKACVEVVAQRWREPDHGIWEIRDVPRHHVHSKMMGWIAVDRGIEILRAHGEMPDEWLELRSAIEADVQANGWDSEIGGFVSAYDRREVDAAVLQPLVAGFPASREQVNGTIRAVEAKLRRGSTVYRYRYDDGLPGDEGAMHICAAWLIEAYTQVGRIDDAEELFSAMLGAMGRTGLLSEQVDPRDFRGLGNHPQAYSHSGVIRAAMKLGRAKAGNSRSAAAGSGSIFEEPPPLPPKMGRRSGRRLGQLFGRLLSMRHH